MADAPNRAGIKPTNAEVTRRIDAVIRLLSTRPMLRKGEIHALLEKQWGVSWRTVDRYLVRARSEMMRRLERDKAEHRCDSLAFYESILANPDVRWADKLRARELIDKLLGLQAPQRIEQSGPGGGPIETRQRIDMSKEEIDRLLRARFEDMLAPVPRFGDNGGNGDGSAEYNGDGNGTSSGSTDA